ncbi:hypothetical protein SBA_ch2_5130 [Sphingomonas bisphenolicum]|uniref:Uncharacterized protein n=1 Tax=Sphingomonas bisphenolicum TaxID=296544 RepID=A0ABN5WIZ7_9SPHN|nr:hypothetical protein SBA_ch2_5130 [Sphingomonas bisphenolicum]
MPPIRIALHIGKESVDAVDDAPQIDVEHPAPVIEGQIRDHADRAYAGIIAENMDCPMPIHDLIGESLNLIELADVRRDALDAELRAGRIDCAGINIGDDHPRTGGLQSFGNAPAHA